MAETIGLIASVLQLIGSISTGLRTLRDGATLVRDARKIVTQIEEKVQRLRNCFTLVENYIKQSTGGLPHELEVHRIIKDLTMSSSSSLRFIQERISSRIVNNMVLALQLWVHDHTMTQAMTQIDEYTQYLSLLLQTLNLFKSDQVDEQLRQIANILQRTAQPRPPITDAALSDIDRKALETVQKVRAFANNTATSLSLQTAGVSHLPSSKTIAPLSPISLGSTLAVDPGPSRVRVRREVDSELAEQKKALATLKALGLFESAVKVQRRVCEIQEELVAYHSVLFYNEERYRIREELADLLVECKLDSCTEEALSILLELLKSGPATHDGAADDNPLPSPPSSFPTQQDQLRIHLKLGQIYKDTAHLDSAVDNLRVVFNAYATESPKDIEKIHDVGKQLLELYSYLVEHGGAEQRAVIIGKLNGFRNELEDVTGCPLQQQPQCGDALAWCRVEGIPLLPVGGQDFRFDIIGADGSSPLHHAAEKCHEEAVIRQILDNSDTLENKDTQGDTPLLVAVGSSNLTALPLLLQRGCNINARDLQYQTPLHRSSKSAVTKQLLEGRLRRTSTMTAGSFEEVRRDSSSSSSNTILSPDTASSASTLPGQELDIDAQDVHKMTALYIACAQGREKIAELLLVAGADPNIARHNQSPLAAAIEFPSKSYLQHPRKRVNVVAALISRNADADAVKNLPSLRKPTGIMREVQKALEGRHEALLLLSPGNSIGEAERVSTDKASGEWSLSSSPSGGS